MLSVLDMRLRDLSSPDMVESGTVFEADDVDMAILRMDGRAAWVVSLRRARAAVMVMVDVVVCSAMNCEE